MKKTTQKWLAMLMLLSILVGVFGVTAYADEEQVQLDYVSSISVAGDANTLNTGIAYPVNTVMNVTFSFVPESSVTRVLLIAKSFAPDTALHDKSYGFVWIDINGEEWSFRSDEGMIFDATNVTKENGVYYVTAAYTTPDVAVNSMYYHIYSDNGTTVFSDIKTTYAAPSGDSSDVPVAGNKATLDQVDTLTVAGEGNTLNTGIHYPVNTTMYVDFSFVPDSNVTRVLVVVRNYAPGTALHDASMGFVWVNINGEEWNYRCDEGMSATVTKEGNSYHVTGFYTTPDVEVESMYYHIYSDNGTTVLSDIRTSYEAPESEEPSTPPKTADGHIGAIVAALVLSGGALVCMVKGKKKNA